MQGKIVKGIAGFYYVYVAESGLFACKAKGIFRKEKIKPLVGDNVVMEITHEGDREGNVIEILPRKNTLIRPAVANIDQALVIFACRKPDPNFHLLDRFLVSMEQQGVPCLLCFNKLDETTAEEVARLRALYAKSGYPICFTSARTKKGVNELRAHLRGKTTAVAGPSGVGKSSLINLLCPQAEMETGEISTKIARGRHTTRHSELFPLGEETFIMDTPGFTSLFLEGMEKEELGACFPEFLDYVDQCRFRGCVHIGEPDCAVKQAVADGEIPEQRYAHYVEFYNELKDQKKY